MIVRPFQPGDIGPVTSLVRTVLATMDLRADYGGLGVDVHAVGEGEASGTWVAEAGDGELMGMAMAQAGEGGGWELRRLYVSSEYEGRGAGSALLERACAWARGRGATRLRIELAVPLRAAAPFFEGRGFDGEDGSLERSL